VHGLGLRYGPHHPVSVVVECERQRQDDGNDRPWSRREEAPHPPRSAIFDPTPAHDKHAIFERHHIPFCSICCSKINNNARLFMVGAEKKFLLLAKRSPSFGAHTPPDRLSLDARNLLVAASLETP